MAAIVTVINKITPAGVFAVCPFLLCCSLLCPTWAPAGAGISPLPVEAKVLALENGQRASCTHGELFLRGGCLAHNAQRVRERSTDAPHGGAPAACVRARTGKPLTDS